MAKRVKKGVRIELPGNPRRAACVAHESSGLLFISPVTDNSFEWSFSAEQCEALGMTAVLEDVPTPGERLLEALESEGLHVTSETRGPAGYMACLERAAEALGIEPEGES